MADAEKVSLDKLRQALQQPNNAIRKRALAIIFNEARIEALPLIEEYLGWETEPDLQGLALKVRRKLQDFQATCSQVPTEKLLALLQHSTTESRILALRGLVEHRSARLAELVCQVCGQETSPEVLTLVAKILRRNPSPGNIPVLLRLIEHPAEEIRQDALEGILSIIFGCLYPLVLKTLLDPSPQLKMRAYQLISNISRPNLLEALDFMFSCGDQAMSRLAGTLLPSFLGPDLLPILDRHLAHADADTAALCKRAVILLAQKGNSEAARLVARIQSENPAKAGAAGPGARPPGPFQEFLATYPRFLTEPLLVDFPLDDPSKILERLREVNARITDLLVFPFILSYFAVANRNPFLDRACFKVLRFGLAKTNPVNFLRTVAPAFPPPAGKDDLFPVVLADRLQNDFNDQTLERYAQLQKALTVTEDPQTDLRPLANQAMKDLADLLRALSFVTDNRLAVKHTDTNALRVADFMPATPAPIDPKLLQNFELAMNIPMLISRDLTRGISLGPYFVFDPFRQGITRITPNENDLWEFLMKRGILENFLAFLKEKPTAGA
jgi:hypothetical protein